MHIQTKPETLCPIEASDYNLQATPEPESTLSTWLYNALLVAGTLLCLVIATSLSLDLKQRYFPTPLPPMVMPSQTTPLPAP